MRFLPKLGPTFFRPFAAKLVINLPDSVCVGQINPGLIDGQDISPFGAVDVAQEPGTSLQPLKNLGIRQGMDTALFPQLCLQILGNNASDGGLGDSMLPSYRSLGVRVASGDGFLDLPREGRSTDSGYA